MHTYARTHVHKHLHALSLTHAYACTHTHTCKQAHTYIHTHTHANAHPHSHTHPHTHKHTHLNTHTNTLTQTHSHKHTYARTHTPAHTHTLQEKKMEKQLRDLRCSMATRIQAWWQALQAKEMMGLLREMEVFLFYISVHVQMCSYKSENICAFMCNSTCFRVCICIWDCI